MKMSNMRNLCLILLGNTVYALAIVMFILPNDIITGGTTGLGIAVNHYFGLQIHTFVLIFNTLMFLLGAAVLGMKFALTTLVSTFYYPIILGILENVPVLQNVTDDKMLSTICGGLMIGLGIGVVIRCGASTGGMDIPPLVLNKKFGLPVSVMLYVFDFAILIFQMVFTNKEEIIYGILLVLIYTVWVYMDMKKGRPCRPAKEEVEAYRPEAPLDVEFAPRKIVLPKELEDGESFPVRRHQIDTNEHVNNCQYIQMAIDVVPECERAGQIRVEYKKSAVMGDIIYPKMAVEEQRKIVELCDAEGNPYAVVEFKEK